MQLKMTKKKKHSRKFICNSKLQTFDLIKMLSWEHCFPLPLEPAEPSAAWVPLAPAAWGLLPGLQGFLDSSLGAGGAQKMGTGLGVHTHLVRGAAGAAWADRAAVTGGLDAAGTGGAAAGAAASARAAVGKPAAGDPPAAAARDKAQSEVQTGQ